ncbi:hypothetical protein HDE_10019 [Halotydeus destructor]|nr:hypothetical protein HDE_10019 [Halotydeus destructor]
MNPSSILLIAMMVSCVRGRDPGKEVADSKGKPSETTTTDASAQNYPGFYGPGIDYYGGDRGSNQQNRKGSNGPPGFGAFNPSSFAPGGGNQGNQNNNNNQNNQNGGNNNGQNNYQDYVPPSSGSYSNVRPPPEKKRLLGLIDT